MSGRIIKAITRTSFNTAGLGLPYTLLNPLGLTHSCFLLRLVNDSNVGITISYDGAIAHDYIRAGSVLDLPGSLTLDETGKTGAWKKGTKVYISGLAGGVGFIFLTGYYLVG